MGCSPFTVFYSHKQTIIKSQLLTNNHIISRRTASKRPQDILLSLLSVSTIMYRYTAELVSVLYSKQIVEYDNRPIAKQVRLFWWTVVNFTNRNVGIHYNCNESLCSAYKIFTVIDFWVGEFLFNFLMDLLIKETETITIMVLAVLILLTLMICQMRRPSSVVPLYVSYNVPFKNDRHFSCLLC